MEFENRVEHDSSRASRHKFSDGVEMRWTIIPYKASGGGVPVPPQPGDDGIPTPEQCPNQHFSTKARFKMELGSSNIGKVLIGYTRWKNNSNPAKSGQYQTLPVIQLIS